MKNNTGTSLVFTFMFTVAALSGCIPASAQSIPPVMVQVPFISIGAGNVGSSGANSTSPSVTCTGGLSTTGGNNYGDGCPANEAGVDTPWGVATDIWGNVYFGDEGHDYLRVIYAGTDTVNGVVNPATVMIEAANATHPGLTPIAGDLYALAGGLLGALSESGSSFFCSGSSGTVALTDDGSGCPATQAFIKGAFGGAVDREGNVFVLDKSNSLVYVVLANTTSLAAQLVTLENPTVTAPQVGYIYQVAGKGGGYVDGVLANNDGELHAPEGLAVDANDDLFIADNTNNAVRMVNGPNTTTGANGPGFIHTIAGNCTSSSCTALAGAPANGSAALGAAFDAPVGIAVDGIGNVYVGDNSAATSGVPSTVRVIYAGGTNNPLASLICLENSGISNCSTSLVVGNVYTIAGGAANSSGSAAIGNGALATSSAVEFDRIQGVALDQHGNVYIADFGSHSVIAELNATTGYLVYLAGDGQSTFALGDFCTSGTTTGAGPMMSDNYGDGCPGPQSISDHVEGNPAFDPFGNIYFADNGDNLVRKLTFNSAGAIGGTFPATNAGSPGTAATSQKLAFTLLTGSSSLPASNMSVAVLTQGSTSSEFADTGTGDTCSGSMTLTGASSGSSGNTDTVCVVPVTFTPAKVGARVGAVQITGTVNSSTQILGTAYLNGIGNGAGLVIDPSQPSTIGSGTMPQGVATDSAGNTYIDFAGTGTLTSTGGALATAAGTGLSSPYQIAVDGAGNVYVADSGNNRIAEFAGGSSTATTAVSDLSGPKGVALDSIGNLYIADTGNKRVLFHPMGNGEQMVLGGGFDTPVAIAVDDNSNVYVADSGLGSIVKIAAISGVQSTVLSGIVPVGLSVDAAGDLEYVDSTLNEAVEIPVSGATVAVVTGLTTPVGIALDSNGGLYVADTANTGVSYYNRTTSMQIFASGSSMLSATLTNIGNQNFIATNNTFTQTDGTDFSLTPSATDGCSFSSPLAAGTNCGVTALFTPVSAGSFSDTATFSGNGVNSGAVTLNLSGSSTSATAGTTTTTLSGLSPASPTYGQSVQVKVTVSATSGSTTPTGTVVFFVDNVAQPADTLVAGSYMLTLPSLSAGSHTISAAYTSTNNLSASNSAMILSFTVAPLAITATVTSPVTVMYGQAIPAIVGTLSGVLAQDAANVAAAFSTTATATSPVGSYPISVLLSGTAAGNYMVTVAPGTFTIAQAATTTGLTSSATSVAEGSSVTFTATVAAASGGTPAGSVVFSSGSSTLNTATLANGVATYTAISLPVGAQSITATYSGSIDFAGSTSPAVSETVSVPGVVGTLSASNVTIQAGSTGTVMLNLSAAGGYTGTGTYSCIMLPADMTCSFAPASSTFTAAATTASTTVTISTKPSTVSALLSQPKIHGQGRSVFTIMAAGIFLPGIFAGLLGFGKRKKLSQHRMMLTVVLLASLAGMATVSGCGSSGASQTPAGTYNIQVEVLAGTVQTIPLTVVVK
jgi:hypothetical protein